MIHSASSTLISQAAVMVPVRPDVVSGPTAASQAIWVKNWVPAPIPMA